MPIRSGHLYILEESSKFHTTPMNSQQLAALIAEMKTKLDTLKKLEERMDKSDKKTGTINDWSWVLHCWRKFNPPQNNHHDNTDNPPNPDDQFLKSIKINVPTFDGRHDPQLFIDWTQLDK